MISIVLAAGEGTRIRALTGGKPKQMLPILGQPIVGRLLRQLNAIGAKRHFLSTHTHSTSMADFLGTLPDQYGCISLVPSLPTKGENLCALLCEARSQEEEIVVAMGDSVFYDSMIPAAKMAVATKPKADICFAVASMATNSSGRKYDIASQRIVPKQLRIGLPYTGMAILQPHIGLALVELGEREGFTSISDGYNALLDAGASCSKFDVGEYFDVNTPSAYERCVAAIR